MCEWFSYWILFWFLHLVSFLVVYRNLSIVPPHRTFWTFRTTGPISTKRGTKLPWINWAMDIQVCSNEGLRFYLRVDKLIYWRLKILILISTGPISTKLGIKHSWVMGIQVCWHDRKTTPLFKGIVKLHWQHFLFRTSGSTSNKLDRKHPLEIGIQFFFKLMTISFSKGR